MKKTIFFLLFALSIQPLFAQKKPAPDQRLAGLDTMLQRVLEGWKAPGCGVAVVEKNKVLFAGGFGFRDVEGKQPATANTLFQIGSSSKAFTAAMIGQLAETGALDLDDPVRTYLPELRLYNDELNTRLSLRDLMCHRSGLPRHDMAWYLNPATRDSLVLRMEFLEPSFGLRERWQYNNYGYLLQGVVAETLTGKSWEDNIRERFFQPLNMTTARFDLWEAPPSLEVAKGYFENEGAIRPMDYYRIASMGPAGSICASASDMANWLLAWVNGGKFEGREVLPSDYVAEAMSAQMVMSGGVPSEENPNIYFGSYGLGWMLSSYYGHYRVEHGGNINGFSATVCFFPSDSVGVVVLVNQNASQAGAVVRNLIIDRLLGLPYRDWHSYLLERAQKQQAAAKETPEAPDLGRKTGTQPSQALSAYAGRYLHPGYGALLVELRNDSLFAHTQSLNFYLEHYHYDIFRPLAMIAGVDLESNSPIRMQFIPDLKGDIAEIRASGLEASVEPLVFKKQATEVAMAESELEKYTGAYTLSGIDCKVYLKNGALYVFVPGQPEYETRPVGNHEFKLTALDGYSVRFDVDSQGKAVAANFIQPNGTFRAVRK